MTDLKSIIAQVNKLNLSDLRELIRRLKPMAAQVNATRNTDRVEDQEGYLFVCECINKVLVARRIPVPFELLIRSADPAFRVKCKTLNSFLNDATKDKREQQALLIIAIHLLYNNLKSMGAAISGPTLMRHIHRVPAVLDSAYPGYAKFGMLQKIIKGKLK